MKRYYYFILAGLITLTGILIFTVKIQSDTEAANKNSMGKEMAYVETVSSANFISDSAKIKEKEAELNNELVKLNAELEALESEVEVVHEEAQASYYHDKFNGRKTANGDIFSNNKLTAAHKSLNFGTKVKVTNIKNNKSVIVTINDRGPFTKGVEIDLSKKAFDAISHDKKAGKLHVKLELMND